MPATTTDRPVSVPSGEMQGRCRLLKLLLKRLLQSQRHLVTKKELCRGRLMRYLCVGRNLPLAQKSNDFKKWVEPAQAGMVHDVNQVHLTTQCPTMEPQGIERLDLQLVELHKYLDEIHRFVVLGNSRSSVMKNVSDTCN